MRPKWKRFSQLAAIQADLKTIAKNVDQQTRSWSCLRLQVVAADMNNCLTYIHLWMKLRSKLAFSMLNNIAHQICMAASKYCVLRAPHFPINAQHASPVPTSRDRLQLSKVWQMEIAFCLDELRISFPAVARPTWLCFQTRRRQPRSNCQNSTIPLMATSRYAANAHGLLWSSMGRKWSHRWKANDQGQVLGRGEEKQGITALDAPRWAQSIGIGWLWIRWSMFLWSNL